MLMMAVSIFVRNSGSKAPCTRSVYEGLKY
jgi:hypothetical protein